tara:strand:- start:2944 stop:3807 length:864 start_codon:yes stop_codon:yes gene_type:complete
MKKKFKSNSGVTLVELLIGVVISSIMMAALYTSYNVVNNSYSQVSDRANISRTGRDITGMLLRDIRMAGYFDINSVRVASNEMYPIIITKSNTFKGDSRKCDEISIVYGDINYVKGPPVVITYPIYKVTYKCIKSKIPDRTQSKNQTGKYPKLNLFAIYKSKIKWDRAANSGNGAWDTDPEADGDPNTYPDELIIDYIEDLIFNPIDKKGLIINPAPSKTTNQSKIYEIRAVDISIVLRSTDAFYKTNKDKKIYSLASSSRDKTSNDKYFREAIVVTAHNRNIGMTK